MKYLRNHVQQVGGLVAAATIWLVCGAASTSNAQSVKLDFRFESTGSNTMSLAPGSAGQTFTVDVYVSVFGDAIHTDPTTYGLEGVHFAVTPIPAAAVLSRRRWNWRNFKGPFQWRPAPGSFNQTSWGRR